MAEPPPGAVTRLLHAWREGDQEARDELIPLVYRELHRVAERQLRREGPGATLRTTALVHEAYVRLAGADVPWADRGHFFAVAARQMRRVLVDRARARNRSKRGGGLERVTLDPGLLGEPCRMADLLALDEALEALASMDPRKARVVELHLFAGLTAEETAEALDISPATVFRELRTARAWLGARLQ